MHSITGCKSQKFYPGKLAGNQQKHIIFFFIEIKSMSIIQKTLKFEVKKEENVTSKSDLSLIWERTESRSEFSTPSSKKGLLDNSPNAESVCKSDLSLIWERTNTLSPFSSPSPKKCFHHDKGNDILSLLVATRKCETPRK